MHNTRRNRKANQGFTLIELLIVIAIIGILAAVLIPNPLNARRNANNTATNSFARNVTNRIASATATDPTTLTARDDAVLVAGGTPAPAAAAADWPGAVTGCAISASGNQTVVTETASTGDTFTSTY